MTAALATAILLDDHTHVEAHQRPYIRSQAAVGGCHQNAFPDPGHTHGDLLNTRVERPGGSIDTLEQLDFFCAADDLKRVIRRIQLSDILRGEGLNGAVLPGTRD